MEDVVQDLITQYVRVNNAVQHHLGVLGLRERRVLGVQIGMDIKDEMVENMMENLIKD
jgi:uncharacterized protein YwlG (UPF0340 family)